MARRCRTRYLKEPAVPIFEARLVFALLGPLFLLLGLWRIVRDSRLLPQAKAWFIIGACFSAVAVWLWWGRPAI